MKHTLKYMIVALAGLMLVACNKKEEIVPDEKPAEKYTYTISVAGDTKSHLSGDHMTWDDGDLIGWFVNNNSFDCSEIDEEATPCTFEVSSATALPANSMVYAFAPCYPSVYETTPTKTNAPLSIPVAQDGTISDAMPMVSVPIEIVDPVAASIDKPIAEAKFLNLGAVIEYNIYTTNAAYNTEKVQSVTFTSDSPIAGDFTVNLTTVAENNIPSPSGLDKQEVISTLASATTVGASKPAGIKVYQVVAPGTHSGTVTVTTDGAIYEYPVTTGKVFERATIRTLNVDLASANATRTSMVDILLAAHQWELKDVKESGGSVTTATGNKLTLNANHTMAFDCSANSGETFDHTWAGAPISPSAYGEISNMRWSTSTSGGKDYLTVTNGYLLVFTQSSTTGTYEIKELTASNFTAEITLHWDWGDDTWTLLFDAVDNTPVDPTPPSLACPYGHDFANGDWGIGPAFDWGGWTDGYYYSMLTTPATLDGASWGISEVGYYEWAGTQAESGWRHGIQLGTGKMTVSSLKLTSSSFHGEITKVTLGYNSGIADNSSLTVSCKVGGAAFGSAVAHGDGDYEAVFTGSATGEIEITVNSTVNGAVYLYYVAVEYDPDGGAPM